MSAENKYRWILQILWDGHWRTIMEHEERKVLVEYAYSCPRDLELRIIDSTEEVKAHGGRH
jgi:hypothetical protein